MKKRWSIGLAAILLCSMVSAPVAAKTYEGSINAINGYAMIDGEIDDAWADAEVQDVKKYPELLGYDRVNTTTTGTVRTMWDEDAFYVLVVVDKKDVPVYPGEDNWSSLSNTDNVLIPFSQVVSEGETDVQSGNANAGAFRITAGGKTNGFGDLYTAGTEKYEAAAKIVGNTYICELAIPWSNKVPVSGDQVMMEVQINVNTVGDDNRYTVVEWCEDNTCEAWANTKYMSLVNLVDAPKVAEPELVEAETTDTTDGIEESTPVTAPATAEPICTCALLCAASALVTKLTRKKR